MFSQRHASLIYTSVLNLFRYYMHYFLANAQTVHKLYAFLLPQSAKVCCYTFGSLIYVQGGLILWHHPWLIHPFPPPPPPPAPTPLIGNPLNWQSFLTQEGRILIKRGGEEDSVRVSLIHSTSLVL